MRRHSLPLAAALSLLVVFHCGAQGTAFTYQGRLNDGSGPATGAVDLRFAVYDTPSDGTRVSGIITNIATPVSNGLFTATLDFGPGVFTGAARWLEIGVRASGPGVFTTLTPRQRLAATPYAITAGNVTGSVSASQLSGSIAPANIAAGTITSTMLAEGSVTASNLASGAVTLAKLDTIPVWTSSTTFTNPTPENGDFFGGTSAALGSDRVLIGANWDNAGALAAGAAYLFSTNGTLLTIITNPSPAELDLFGLALAVAGGDKFLIGAYLKDVVGASNAGAAYLFDTNGASLATFTNPTPALDENFGWAVAGLGADKIVIAANNDAAGAIESGSAYIYNLNGTLLVTITNPTPAVNDQFGYQAVAVGSDKVLISSILDDTLGTNTGAVYLFNANGTLLTTLTNPMPAQTFVFGFRLAAVGNDRMLITAAFPNSSDGIVFLYNINGQLLATFGPAAGLGASLAFVGPDKIAISAAGDGAGSVTLFNTNGTFLARIANPTPASGAFFGYSLAVLGDRLLVGAPQDNTGAIGSGVAHLFGMGAQYIPGLVGDGSFAASLGNLAIDSIRIVDGTIAEVDLADGAVSDAKISGVSASKLTGMVPDALLSPNVALTFANQTFTGQNIFNNPANTFAGNGSALSALDASKITSGTVGEARLSANVPLLNANQTFTGANTFNNAGNSFTGSFSGNGSGLTSLSAGNIASGTLADARLSANIPRLDQVWQLGGNAGTSPASHFLGTTDNQALTLRVNNTVVLQYLPAPTVPNIVAGLAALRPSVIGNGVSGAVIAGGNAPSGAVNGFGGGDFQAVYDDDGVVGGGFGNKVGSNNGDVTDSAFATVAGGVFNGASGYASTVAGGDGNTSAGSRAAIGGGYGNIASGNFSTISGGLGNQVSGDYGTIAGGNNNFAVANAFAAGTRAKTINPGSFVWADSQAADFFSSVNNDFSIRAAGGVRLNTDTSIFFGSQVRQMLNLWGAAYGIGVQSATVYFRTDAGGGFSWFRGGSHSDSQNAPGAGGTEVMRLDSGGHLNVRGNVTANSVFLTSDRSAKENIEQINSREVLEKVVALPITRWNFKGDTATPHVGPMAQDFQAAFSLGADDRHIATVDADGIALAAIQGLNQKVEAEAAGLRAENALLKKELSDIKQLLTKILESKK